MRTGLANKRNDVMDARPVRWPSLDKFHPLVCFEVGWHNPVQIFERPRCRNRKRLGQLKYDIRFGNAPTLGEGGIGPQIAEIPFRRAPIDPSDQRLNIPLSQRAVV